MEAVEAVTDERLERARAGDGEAFRQLTEPYRAELRLHCYRMLGSLHDAEDVLQESLLAAWQGLSGFESRSSVRTWLYRIATNRCLNARRAGARRPESPAEPGTLSESGTPAESGSRPSRVGEVVWLEPFPDALLPGPETGVERAETVSLAFVTALQLLPPRQVAVLLLREVLDFRASEVASMLDTSVESVNSALKRARAALRRQFPAGTAEPPAPQPPESAEERALVDRFVRAYQAGDVADLVTLLTDDVLLSMPPVPLELHGREAVAAFLTQVLQQAGRSYTLVPTRANRRPAFGAYLRTASGTRQGAGLLVLDLDPADGRISALTRFDGSLLPLFGLPPRLPV